MRGRGGLNTPVGGVRARKRRGSTDWWTRWCPIVVSKVVPGTAWRDAARLPVRVAGGQPVCTPPSAFPLQAAAWELFDKSPHLPTPPTSPTPLPSSRPLPGDLWAQEQPAGLLGHNRQRGHWAGAAEGRPGGHCCRGPHPQCSVWARGLSVAAGQAGCGGGRPELSSGRQRGLTWLATMQQDTSMIQSRSKPWRGQQELGGDGGACCCGCHRPPCMLCPPPPLAGVSLHSPSRLSSNCALFPESSRSARTL